ncbi:AI-2E family transporter [Paenibacillus wulumuqiensis]|uniref:AI-2E family transporter n=1 Tax=Paenibacillus wulumuqiensis TaxID=1567107 RepID=UPI0006195F26|nr:AI-2E family transporter [Paenibacillus wulumuqiensis]
MIQNRFFRIGAGIALILLIIYLGTLVDFIFVPIRSLISLTIVPLLITAFIYYPLRPLVNWLERKRKVKRSMSILMIYVVIILALVIFSMIGWPTLRDQVTSFVQNTPEFTNSIIRQVEALQHNSFIQQYLPDRGGSDDMLSRLTEYLNTVFTWLSDHISSMFSFVSNIVLVIATVPIMLYYLLKDDKKLSERLVLLFPQKFREDGKLMLAEIDDSLSSFIAGRVLVNFALCILLYIGFLIIDLPYSLLLVFLAFFLNFIPYIGAILSAVPVAIVGFIDSPMMGIWAIVIVIVAQLIQNNLLEPIIFGNQLDIHPFTIIVLLLVGGDMGGILGMLLVIPIYMAVKITIVHIYRMYLKEKIGNDFQ